MDTKQLGKSKTLLNADCYKLTKDFQKNPKIKKKAQTFMKEYQHLGHIQPVKNPVVWQT
jgi:hypothetical protein